MRQPSRVAAHDWPLPTHQSLDRAFETATIQADGRRRCHGASVKDGMLDRTLAKLCAHLGSARSERTLISDTPEQTEVSEDSDKLPDIPLVQSAIDKPV